MNLLIFLSLVNFIVLFIALEESLPASSLHSRKAREITNRSLRKQFKSYFSEIKKASKLGKSSTIIAIHQPSSKSVIELGINYFSSFGYEIVLSEDGTYFEISW